LSNTRLFYTIDVLQCGSFYRTLEGRQYQININNDVPLLAVRLRDIAVAGYGKFNYQESNLTV